MLFAGLSASAAASSNEEDSKDDEVVWRIIDDLDSGPALNVERWLLRHFDENLFSNLPPEDSHDTPRLEGTSPDLLEEEGDLDQLVQAAEAVQRVRSEPTF